MPPTLAASAWLLLAAMVVGSRGSPMTTLPDASGMLDIVGIIDAVERPGAQSVGVGAAAGALLLGAGVAAVARQKNITQSHKTACKRAFDVFAGAAPAGDLPRQLPADVRARLASEHKLADAQIDRQYRREREPEGSSSPPAVGSTAAAATQPAASSARAASSAGAAGAAGSAPTVGQSSPDRVRVCSRTTTPPKAEFLPHRII
jgi:hypothetical protein